MSAQNMVGNEDFMPQFDIDCKELLVFRAWAASGWVCHQCVAIRQHQNKQ